MWWSGFPPLHGNISWGPISILESAQLFWSHVAYQQYLGSSYKVMSRTPRYPHQSLPVSMSTKQASFNVLTANVRSVRPWRSRFNLVSQCLTTFHMWWSGFPPLHGNISWGPISILESAQLFWSHVAYQQYLGSSYKVMSRTPKYPHQSLPISMSTKQASLNVLTDKVRSVRPWRSRFNLVSQGLTTFQVWRSCCPALDGNISQWHPWGPISFGVRPNLLISCCTPAIPCFHLPNWMQLLMWCQGRLMGERLGNRAIWTSGCRIQGVSKVVRPCERPRNSRVWWSSNGEWQTNTCEFCSGIFQGYRNESSG